MSNSYFRFKQFTVRHDLCAMKVGTDGVLLGAWAPVVDAKRILDAGTGSGLIALMLAQRSGARIDAIDIDENACKQAGINFSDSPFAGRLTVLQGDFVNYSPGYTYDLIVSNPPYFMNSLKSPDSGRNAARHTDTLSYSDLLTKSGELLSEKGRLSLILPVDAFERIQLIARSNHFHLLRKTMVRPTENRPPKRILLEYVKLTIGADEPCPYGLTIENEMVIEKSPAIYSEEFIALVRDYYLHVTDI